MGRNKLTDPKFRARLLAKEMCYVINLILLLNIFIHDHQVFLLLIKNIDSKLLHKIVSASQNNRCTIQDESKRNCLKELIQSCKRVLENRTTLTGRIVNIVYKHGISILHIVALVVIPLISKQIANYISPLLGTNPYLLKLRIATCLFIILIIETVIQIYFRTSKMVIQKLTKMERQHLIPQDCIIRIEQKVEFGNRRKDKYR